MQTIHVLRIVALCSVLPFCSCGSDGSQTNTPETPGTSETPGATVAPLPATPAPTADIQAVQPAPAASPATAAAPAGGVQHYICPKNCKGSGGAATGNCPVCGTAYVHNAAFHAQGNNAPAPAGSTAANPTQPAPSPAKNAAGVYHYTCLKGCAGGAGSAGKCATCGGDLTHNAAYHQ